MLRSESIWRSLIQGPDRKSSPTDTITGINSVWGLERVAAVSMFSVVVTWPFWLSSSCLSPWLLRKTLSCQPISQQGWGVVELIVLLAVRGLFVTLGCCWRQYEFSDQYHQFTQMMPNQKLFSISWYYEDKVDLIATFPDFSVCAPSFPLSPVQMLH